MKSRKSIFRAGLVALCAVVMLVGACVCAYAADKRPDDGSYAESGSKAGPKELPVLYDAGPSLMLYQFLPGEAHEDTLHMQPYDTVLYMLEIRNDSDRRFTGDLSVSIPVLPEAMDYDLDGGELDGMMVRFDDTEIAPVSRVYRVISIRLPGTVDTYAWGCQAHFRYEDGFAAPAPDGSIGIVDVLSPDVTGLFGTADVKATRTDEGDDILLSVSNNKDATGGANKVRIQFSLKDGTDFKELAKLWHGVKQENGTVEYSVGALVPGGHVDVRAIGVKKFLKPGTLHVLYDTAGETDIEADIGLFAE